MDTDYLKRELAQAGREASMGKTAKGAMGKIRDHAKKKGEEAFGGLLSAIDDVVNGSREWNEAQKSLFRLSALEAVKQKLEKELR